MSENEQDRRETLADIVAMLRANARGERFDEFSFTSLADRIEAAAKRVVVSKTETTTVGNAAAMRDALDEIIDKIDNWRTGGTMEHWQYSQLFDVADSALSAPARQCDVGTAEEQSERMEKAVCSKHLGCVRCPLRKAKYSDCSLWWAQTPYAEEGGAGK